MILYLLLAVPLVGIFFISSVRSYYSIVWEEFSFSENHKNK
jgi:ABC-type spermidine/putrescine transport system permease subunit II